MSIWRRTTKASPRGSAAALGPTRTVVVAPRGAVHGVVNRGAVPLVFIGVGSPALSGFELL